MVSGFGIAPDDDLQLKHVDQVSLARRRLAEEYGLGDNCDLLYTLADSLYSQLRFADCFVVTSR
jgi:anaphase-promoting complex subunit 6